MSSPYRVLGLTLLPLLRARISDVEGAEHLPRDGRYILVANHQSWIDSPILAAAVYQHLAKSLRFVAQSSKYRMLGGIPINEYDPASVLDVASGYLSAGHPIAIFPEGNSNPKSELRLGKTGAARLALYAGVPVIPVGIQGTAGVFAGAALVWLLSWWRPCRVVIGPPLQFEKIETSALTKERLEMTTSTIMSGISNVSGKPYNASLGRQPRGASILQKILHRVVMPVLRFRVRATGVDHLPLSGPFIIAGNHSSYFDPGSVMIAVFNARHIQPFFLTKGAIAQAWKRLLGPEAWNALGMLPIDTQDKSKVLRTAVSHLRRGGVVGIFPEGTRNKPALNPDWETTMLKSKTGAARLALETGMPVVPAALFSPAGIGIAQTIVQVLQFWKPVRIIFGPPMTFPTVSDPTREKLDEVTRQIMQHIGALRGLAYPY